MTQQPQAKYRHDYRAPDYQITDIDLTFDLDAQKTVVTAVSQAVRHGASDVPLRLNGEDLKLVSVYINDEPWTAWKEEEGALVISNLPERFTLKIVNEISPAANTALEGLYQSGDALCTQCEAEGFYQGIDSRWTHRGELGVPVTFTTGLNYENMSENRKGYNNFRLNRGVPEYGQKGELRRDERNLMWNVDPYLQTQLSHELQAKLVAYLYA